MTADLRTHRQPAAGRRRIGVLLHRWHRRLGATAAIFLIWLASSGILLNQAAALRLDDVRIGWPWLMHWYGLDAQVPLSGWSAGDHWLATIDDEAVVDGRTLVPPVHAPLGMVLAGGILYVASSDSLILLQPDGKRIDTLRAPPLPVTTIRRIGVVDQRIAIQDLDAYASIDGEDWSAVASSAVCWVQMQPLPADVRARIGLLARPSLPLSRIVADAHSGRILGRYGVALVNLIGLFCIALAVSGLWLWQRGMLRHRRSDHA